MGRGGARPGAGRKPKTRGGSVVEFPGGGPIDVPPAPAGATPSDDQVPAAIGVPSSLLEPPADLPDAQQVVWRAFAPLAVEQRTLVAQTVPGFRELCQLVAFKEELAARVAKFGSDAALKHFSKLSPRVDAALARFKLTAFGKPADGAASKKPVANPWAAVNQ